MALAHLLTFGGQAVACAAGSRISRSCSARSCRSARQGKYLLGLLQGLRSHPTVGDVHGLGLMCAAELVKDKATKEPSTPAPAWRAIAACWS